MTRRRRCTLIAALSLATVAGAGAPSAPAQSSGDAQYQDPFAAGNTDSSDSSSTSSSAGSGAAPMSGGDPLTAAPPSESSGATPVSEEGSEAASFSSGRELPATGARVALVALAGLGMLLAGIGLRLREPGG